MKTSLVIEYLMEYNLNLARVRDIDLQIEELHGTDNYIQGGNVLSERVSKTYKFSSSTEDIAIRIADMIVMLEEEKKHLFSLKARIDNAINSLDETEKKIVTMKYLDNQKWYTIAAEIKMYERWCRKLNSAALEKMGKILSM